MWTQYDKATHIQHIGECLITFNYYWILYIKEK
jgi:hypothetical protein